VTVTVVEDDGRLAGTAVFNIISREDQPHVIASEPHLLRATTLQGDTLHFLIKAFQDRKELQFNMKSTTDGKARLTCLNCDSAVETEVVRAPVHPTRQ